MREPELVRLIESFARQTPQPKQLIRGIGDDSAIVRPLGSQDLVFTTDFTIEGRHFLRADHSAADVGHKALARSLSDLAAMGASPLFCLVALAVPDASVPSWVRGFYRGLCALANSAGIALAGGDLSKNDRVVIDVMCCGSVPRGAALTRSGAKPGDAIYVTGTLGESALGLATKRGRAWRRHKRPEARLAVGQKLLTLASAAMDLSDGLSLDLNRLCAASGVGAALQNSLPVAPGATPEQALHGGEDYELLFTASPRRKIPSAIAGVQVTRIGTIINADSGITLNGQRLSPLGFDHFKSERKK